MRLRIAAGAAVALVASVYVMRLDPAAGLYVDDAWYVVLATALVNGDGFRLISSATTPILPAFPPGFPLILAPVVAVWPLFPDNVIALKSVSVIAMFLLALVTYRYFVRYRELPPAVAGTIAVITVLTPAFVFLATSTIMAEPVFALSQVVVAIAVERSVNTERHSTASAAFAGVLAGAMLLIRLAGVAGVVAGALYLAARKGARAATVFALVTAACYAPWAIYSQANRASQTERVTHGGSIAYGYSELLLMRYGGEPSSGRITIAELPGRIAFNVINVLGRDVGALLWPGAYRGPLESGQEAFVLSGESGLRATSMGSGAPVMALSFAMSAVVVVGFIAALRRRVTVAEYIVPLTAAMVVLVPASTFRYLLPLAPFFIFYFLCGVEAVVAALRRHAWGFGSSFRIVAACLLVLSILEHAQYVQARRHGPVPWLQDYADVKRVTDWMNQNLRDPGAVATSNPGLVFLTTGRKTVALSNPRQYWSEWQGSDVRYAVAVHEANKPPGSLPHRILYQTRRGTLWVAQILTPDDMTETDKRF